MALGGCLRELNQLFYGRPKRTVFGAVLIWRDKETGELNMIFFTVLSKDMGQDSFFVSHALKAIMETQEFKEASPTHLSIWMDNGPGHFRTNEFQAIIHEEFCGKRGINAIDLNFFTESHGKNIVDSHFSMVGRAINEWTLEPDRQLLDTKDLAECLEEYFSRCQERRVLEEENRKKCVNPSKFRFRIESKTWKAKVLQMDELPPQPQFRRLLVVEMLNAYSHFRHVQTSDGKTFHGAAYSDSHSILHPLKLNFIEKKVPKKRKAGTTLVEKEISVLGPQQRNRMLFKQELEVCCL